MQKSFGAALQLNLSLARPWLNLGPGWAALAGLLSSGYPALTYNSLLRMVVLWLLVEPLLGAIWETVVTRGLWRQIIRADLPRPTTAGFSLPYAQPGSAAGRLVLRVRRYQRWWRATFWPTGGDQLLTVGLGSLAALVIGWTLHPSIFWLVLLTLALTMLAGLLATPLSSAGGGRLDSLAQFLLPWGMGLLLFPNPAPVSLLLGFCYWVVYLGGLRLLGHHARAKWLLFGGQVAVIFTLLAVQLFPAAAFVGVMLAAQLLVNLSRLAPAAFVEAIRLLLLSGLLVSAAALGYLAG